MRLLLSLFPLGWWLTRQRWMAEGQYHSQYHSAPSISVNPSNVIATGENVSISCKKEWHQRITITFTLWKQRNTYDTIRTDSNEAEFHIVNAQIPNSGEYACTFDTPSTRSYPSRTAYISVREQVYSSPSILVIPSDMVVLGKKFTIQCTNEYDQYAVFSLIKKGASNQPETQSTTKMAEFFNPSARESDGGIYFCDYQFYQGPVDQYSKFSNRIYINITDPRASKPSIHVEPKGQQILNGNVAIHCQGPENDLNFSLYRSADFIASQRTKPESSLAEFPILGVRLEDAGNYSCRYQLRKKPFVWSNLSDPVKLEVRAGFSTALWASTAAVLFLLAILILVLILYRKRRKGSTTRERNLPVKMLSELAVEEAPDEVSYAAINHSSLKTRSTALPNTAPEPCVYAAVSDNRTKEIQ